jgi:hypothetical protein
MGTDASVEIAVPQRYKDFVVKRQYRWFWLILLGVLGGINVVYYLLCAAFHWAWTFYFQGDIVFSTLGLISYVVEVRKPWRYEVNERAIKLFRITPKTHLGNLTEVGWAKTQVVGVEQTEWQGLPALSLTVLPSFGYTYLLVYDLADEEEVKTTVLPMIEKYRRNYRQELWAERLRS